MLTVPAGYSGLVKVGSEHVFPDPIVDNNVCRLAGLPDSVKMSATVLSGKHGKQPAMENGTVGSSRDCGYEPLFSETSRFEDVVKGKSTAAYRCDSGGLQVRFSEQCDAPTRHMVPSEGSFFFFFITFTLAYSNNVKHLTCIILCSSGLQNINTSPRNGSV